MQYVTETPDGIYKLSRRPNEPIRYFIPRCHVRKVKRLIKLFNNASRRDYKRRYDLGNRIESYAKDMLYTDRHLA